MAAGEIMQTVLNDDCHPLPCEKAEAHTRKHRL